MGFFDDLGLGAAKPGTLTSLFDPGDLLGTKSGKDAREAAKKAAAEQEEAAKTAAQLQKEASDLAIAEQRRQFDITQESFRPFQEAGVSALTQQQALLGLSGAEAQQQAFAGLTQSPGQQFIQDRAQKNLLRNAAAIGGTGGGNVRSALVEQGAGFAQQDLQNQFGRLGQIAGQGQAATSAVGQLGQASSGNVANLLAGQGLFGAQSAQQAAQARASGILGQQQARAQQQQQIQGLASTVGSFFLSDPKLKENVKKIGVANGFNWYTWTWNKLANKLGLSGDSWGVMANEVKAIKPELIKEKGGYMMVNYSRLGG